MAFCYDLCLKVKGKCEDCVLRRIGKYKKNNGGLPEKNQVVIITHQPIGNRPRLVSESDLASVPTTPQVAADDSFVAPLSSEQSHPGHSDEQSQHHHHGHHHHHHHHRANTRHRPKWQQKLIDAEKAKQKELHRSDDNDDDDEAGVCSPMLTKSEQVQPDSMSPKCDSQQSKSRNSSAISGDDSNLASEGGDGADFETCQSLRFATLYQPGNSRLQITVKSFCILPSGLSAGCYVVISLMHNNGSEMKLVHSYKTTIKRKTKIPEWEETFVIDDVQRPTKADETVLRLDVMAFDQFSRETCVGHIATDVNTLKDCVSQEFFRGLEGEPQDKETDKQTSDTSLLVGLFYHHTTQTLVLDMIKAKTLASAAVKLASAGHQSQSMSAKHIHYYIRARIYEGSGLVKERRTSERKVTEDVLNESLTFNLERRNIRNISAEFTIFIRSKKDERQLGWFSLGATPSGNNEKEHWTNMLRSHASPVVQWVHFRKPTSPLSSPIPAE